MENVTLSSVSFYTLKQVKEKEVMYLAKSKIGSPDDANEIINTVLHLQDESVEKFGILTLNTKMHIAGIHILSVGSLNASIVHPREVFKSAMMNNAASIICFHNHPSGDPTPSKEDCIVTDRLKQAGEIMGIELMDHVIIGEGRKYCSMKQDGLM